MLLQSNFLYESKSYESYTFELIFYKNLSIWQVECSGPAPSNPWGSNNTIPDYLSHFDSLHIIYWSIINYAGL